MYNLSLKKFNRHKVSNIKITLADISTMIILKQTLHD